MKYEARSTACLLALSFLLSLSGRAATQAVPIQPLPTPVPVIPVAVPVSAETTSGPLPAAAQQALAQITPDPAPPELVRNTHYVVSNEDRHDLFRRSVENRGGVLIGVGTDQNYVLAGWAKPQLLILFDFDQVVVNVHRVYRAFFLNAKTPAELKNLWDPRHEAQAMAILLATYPDEKKRVDIVHAYRLARHAVMARFNKVLMVFKQHNISCFLNDQAQYDTVVALFRNERVVMTRGDLTAGGCMNSIANALTTIGMKVGILYLSNAERYFTYTPAFRKSLLALPVDEKAVVLRTRARLDGVYEYMSQDASVFRSWLERGKITIASQMSRLREADPQTPGAWVIKKVPPAAPQSP